LPDRPYQLACLAPIEDELKKRGHTVIRSGNPLPKEDIDATIATTYMYLRDEFIKKIKQPIFFSEHGVAVVKDGFRKTYHVRADYVMQSGPMWHERAQYVSPKYNGNLIVGYPKSDEIYMNMNNSQSIKNDVIKELSLDPKEPVIVYAPTWYDTDCYNPGSTTLLDSIENLGYKNLITCFHDFDIIGQNLKGKRYIKTPNKNRYLLAADLLIGDYSSIVLEFAILNRPIVQINAYDDLNNFYIWREKDYGIFQIGEIAKKDSLKKAIDDALENPDKFEFLRKFWVERAFYNLGQASKIAVDHMEKLVKT